MVAPVETGSAPARTPDLLDRLAVSANSMFVGPLGGLANGFDRYAVSGWASGLADGHESLPQVVVFLNFGGCGWVVDRCKFMRFAKGLLLVVVMGGSALQAGQFLNLDFESPHLPIRPVEGFEGLPSDAFPSWEVRVSNLNFGRVFLNVAPLAGARVALFGPLEVQPNPKHDLYSARLFAGFMNDNELHAVSVSQAGLIPSNARSLRLEARIIGEYHVTLDGTAVSMALSST